MNASSPSHIDLQATAKQIMIAHGFEPDFPPEVSAQLAQLRAHPPQVTADANVRDLRSLLWSSIDNDTSRDLDQIEVAERLPNGDVKVMVGIADVDAFVSKTNAHRSARGARNHYGLCRRAQLPNASGGIVHRADFFARKSGSPRRGLRVRSRSRRWRKRRPALPRARPQPGAIAVQLPGSVAGREGFRSSKGRCFKRLAGTT